MHRLKPRQNTRDISHIHGLFPGLRIHGLWPCLPRVHTACTYRLEINGVPLTDGTIATIYTREQISIALLQRWISAPLGFGMERKYSFYLYNHPDRANIAETRNVELFLRFVTLVMSSLRVSIFNILRTRSSIDASFNVANSHEITRNKYN